MTYKKRYCTSTTMLAEQDADVEVLGLVLLAHLLVEALEVALHQHGLAARVAHLTRRGGYPCVQGAGGREGHRQTCEKRMHVAPPKRMPVAVSMGTCIPFAKGMHVSLIKKMTHGYGGERRASLCAQRGARPRRASFPEKRRAALLQRGLGFVVELVQINVIKCGKRNEFLFLSEVPVRIRTRPDQNPGTELLFRSRGTRTGMLLPAVGGGGQEMPAGEVPARIRTRPEQNPPGRELLFRSRGARTEMLLPPVGGRGQECPPAKYPPGSEPARIRTRPDQYFAGA
eukprot:gene1517-biopygen22841